MAERLKETEARLRRSGLRPTRQRIALASLLFAKGDRHLTVEELHEEALAADVPVSLATVYNTLHQFTEAGL
ncbi:MAG: transcriptional repressor, partial [Rhizobiaceae bacterium]|nr:transcriptional repressor [Rhizobiaceae bacterium]